MAENKGEKGSTFGAVIGTVVLAVVCAVGGWIARELIPQEKPVAVNPLAAMAGMPQTVAVTNVEMKAYNLPEKFVAHAEAVQEVDLLPQVDGYIKEILFKEGDVVTAGQLLYVLDDERYQAVVYQR